MSFADKLKNTKGQERTDLLPMWGSGIVEGAAVIGRYVGAGTFQTDNKDENGNATGKREVRFIKLADCIEFQPVGPNAEQGSTLQHFAMGVPLNSDTRNKLDPDTLPVGSYLLIAFTHKDERYGNMRRFRVEILTRGQYLELVNAEAGA